MSYDTQRILLSEFCWQRCVIRSSIVMSYVFFGEMLPRFDLVMGVVGGLFTGPITFIFPPLLYKKYRTMLAERSSNREVKITAAISDVTSSDRTVIERLLRFKEQTKQFLKKHFFTLEVSFDEGEITPWENFTLLAIIAVGTTAALTATAFSIRGAIWSTQYAPPCLFGVTAASKLIFSN